MLCIVVEDVAFMVWFEMSFVSFRFFSFIFIYRAPLALVLNACVPGREWTVVLVVLVAELRSISFLTRNEALIMVALLSLPCLGGHLLLYPPRLALLSIPFDLKKPQLFQFYWQLQLYVDSGYSTGQSSFRAILEQFRSSFRAIWK